MVHWHYIGFIDPRRPIDLSQRPSPPLPVRPMPPDLVARLAEQHGVVRSEEVVDRGGYFLSHLGSFGKLHPFEAALVAEGCIVLSEMGMVVQPPEAVAAYNEFVAEWAVSHAEPGTAADGRNIS
ncbi:hypothetical protein [Tuwongella immobilis]|uniref:Uncharacterized protein n=1 Tax=Tuwongella immobilis TaxID=692036 RepID=A0A6C2YW53_9BACT|nr:hypothetical protein [Tuwongella immobilis]VIP05115.1 unnamed protein product [Tuwongella immobilis]VTS07586.1 unnamed protein product [Tuwongella immobilis]